jgi:hypothetical protein
MFGLLKDGLTQGGTPATVKTKAGVQRKLQEILSSRASNHFVKSQSEQFMSPVAG